MENYENIYNSICRLCLSYSNSKKMVSLIDKNSQDGLTAYAKAVSTFAHISFSKEDCFPSYMCLKCLYLLKKAIHFKLVAESSDNCLKKLKDSVGNDGENLKEKIIEFTMLKFYFPNECFKSEETTSQCSDVNHVMGKDKKAKEYQSSNNSVDDIFFDNPIPESVTEQDIAHKKDKILDEIESLIGSHTFKSQSPITVQKQIHHLPFRKIKRLNRKLLKEQYKQEMGQRRIQKRNFVCNVCNRVLANKNTYDHHMQRHQGCRYICEHCGKGFPILNELQMHQVTKHGTGPYLQCSQCHFKAPRKLDLIEHIRLHTGERPYTCDQCGLTFRRREIWRKHCLHHSDKKVQCPQCPRKFYQRSEMLAHANNIHDRVYVYACSHCDVRYTKTATVRRHMTERHGIPREMQGKIIRINKVSSYRER
ncbi:zinc finger protein Paris-like [Maniola hyperantus]|uniref:zinc finger protein Paris-like n=1 Tax=Aphantopus hyperantus TaxID=2795564 RepID=UPI0015695B5C|nr:zinc finger protein interacting with ribonucleoprotein K-like [Maniola hyperantus]